MFNYLTLLNANQLIGANKVLWCQCFLHISYKYTLVACQLGYLGDPTALRRNVYDNKFNFLKYLIVVGITCIQSGKLILDTYFFGACSIIFITF